MWSPKEDLLFLGSSEHGKLVEYTTGLSTGDKLRVVEKQHGAFGLPTGPDYMVPCYALISPTGLSQIKCIRGYSQSITSSQPIYQ